MTLTRIIPVAAHALILTLVLSDVLWQPAHADQAPVASADQATADNTENTSLPVDLTVPDGFVPSPEQARPLVYKLRSEVHLGGLRARASARAWHSESAPATLFITSMVSEEAVELPDVAIHSELEQLRQTPERVALAPEDTRTLSYTTGAAGQAMSATLHWQHNDYQTETQIRALTFQNTAGTLYFVQADCVYPIAGEGEGAAASNTPGAADICQAILASMRPAAQVGELRPLSPEALTGAKEPPVEAGAQPDQHSPSAQAPQLQLRAPGSQSMPAIAIEREKERDYSRYLYVLGGIFLIVAFYFTARSRNASSDDDEDTGDARGDESDDDGGDDDGGDDDGGDDDGGDDDGGDDDGDDDGDESSDEGAKNRSDRKTKKRSTTS